MENQQIIMIVAMVALVAVIAGVYLLFKFITNHKKAGRGREDGAERAVAAARSFARSNSFRCIVPAGLETDKGNARLDAIVVGYFGVLGVKAYGYNGEIYGSAGEKEWLQVSPREEREKFPNPMDEASADVRVIREALFAAKLKQIPVEVVCVFTDPKVQLAVPKETGYLNMQGFKNLLAKEKYLDDKGFDLDKVENAIQAVVKKEQ